MKQILLVLGVCILFLLTSCATAIQSAKAVEPFELTNVLDSTVRMDFIGFKIDSNILSTSSSSKLEVGALKPKVKNVMSEFDQAKAISNTESLRKLGYILENHGMADDMSSTYFGIYSLQEMELYKSKNRYVTFVEVAKSNIMCNDNSSTQGIFAGIGGGFLGVGLPFAIVGGANSNYNNSSYSESYNEEMRSTGKALLGVGLGFSIGGLLCLIPALAPTKTKLDFSGVYNIYIYDTQRKAILRKEAVSVNVQENFKGSYSYDEQSQEIVHNYISGYVGNALLRKYEELNNWLSHR